jgi:hypothetical protein
VLAAEHLLRLAGFDFPAELVEPAREVVEHRFTGLRPLDQHGEIVDPRLQRIAQPGVVFEPAAALQQLLRRSLILPEIRVRDPLLDPRQLLGRT